ncbi:MAG TPA: flagellar motor switch protein FliM [Steroidobacteraceae bacterium]|nr:flagellar motor switch protein FliM [Steroidobacteraceae bacterium]
MSDDSPVLNPNEIEALLHAAPRGAVRGAGRAAGKTASEPAPYDFAKPGAKAGHGLPELDRVGDRLVRGLRGGLFMLLRRMAEVSRKPITLERFGAYAAGLTLPTSLNIVRLAPLPGKALIVLQPELVFAGLDALFGGKGRKASLEGREFTAIEGRVVEILVRQASEGLVEAWAPLGRLSVEAAGMEVDPRFARIVAPDEAVAVLRLAIGLESGAGEMHFVLPESMLQSVREQLAAEPAPRRSRDPAWAQAVRRELRDVPVDVHTSMGSVSITLADFARLAPGDVLPCSFSGGATLEVDGITVRRGTLAQLRGRQVVRIESHE